MGNIKRIKEHLADDLSGLKKDIKGIALLGVALMTVPLDYVTDKLSKKKPLETIKEYLPVLDSELKSLIDNQEEIKKISINPDATTSPKSELEQIIRNYNMNNSYTAGSTQKSNGEFIFTSAAYAITQACRAYLNKWGIDKKTEKSVNKLWIEISNLSVYINKNQGIDKENLLKTYLDNIDAYGKSITSK